MMGFVSVVLFVLCAAVMGASALVGAACIGNALGEWVARRGGVRPVVRRVRSVVRSAGRSWSGPVWRMRRLRVVWAVREYRRRGRLVWGVVRADALYRWGMLRGAAVLFAVCVPVWMTRYQVVERLDGFTGGAVVWFRSVVSVNFSAAGR